MNSRSGWHELAANQPCPPFRIGFDLLCGGGTRVSSRHLRLSIAITTVGSMGAAVALDQIDGNAPSEASQPSTRKLQENVRESAKGSTA